MAGSVFDKLFRSILMIQIYWVLSAMVFSLLQYCCDTTVCWYIGTAQTPSTAFSCRRQQAPQLVFFCQRSCVEVSAD